METTNLLKPSKETGHVISIMVRRVNEIANKLQSQHIYPMLVKNLHDEVLEAVQSKQTHLDIDYGRWQTIKSLVE